MTSAHGAVYIHWHLPADSSSCSVLRRPNTYSKGISVLGKSSPVTIHTTKAVASPIMTRKNTLTYDANLVWSVRGTGRVETVYEAV
jgi:hypothetical protein